MAKSATVQSNGSHRKPVGTKAADNSGLKNKKFVVVAAVVVLGMAGMIFAGMPEGNAPKASAGAASQSGVPMVSSNSAPLTSREASFDFGSISMAAGKVTHRYRIANGSADPLVIQKIYTSCMCTTATLVKGVQQFGPFGMPGHGPIPAINQTLVPGEKAYVEVVFDPAAHGPAGVGPIERVVTIENSARQPFELAFAARVTP
jgi:hypothetical protein